MLNYDAFIALLQRMDTWYDVSSACTAFGVHVPKHLQWYKDLVSYEKYMMELEKEKERLISSEVWWDDFNHDNHVYIWENIIANEAYERQRINSFE